MAKLSSEEWSAPLQPIALQLMREHAALPPEKRADLLATIHDRLVPELIAAHWRDVGPTSFCADARTPPTEAEVATFAEHARRQDLAAALEFVEALVRGGVSLEVVLLHLVAPAARLLGEQWQADVVSWVDVTAGLGTLQQVVHVFGPTFAPGVAHRGLVVLLAAPREQHTLGVYLLAEFFRRGGWDVHVDPTMSPDDLVALASSERVEMVGISVSCAELIRQLAPLVAAVKQASINPHVAVALGGSLDLAGEAERLGVPFFGDPREAVCWLDGRATVGCGGGT
jgi:methanogenic corrinoid protein MtbC1